VPDHKGKKHPKPFHRRLISLVASFGILYTYMGMCVYKACDPDLPKRDEKQASSEDFAEKRDETGQPFAQQACQDGQEQ
jgi:hypothetical protein